MPPYLSISDHTIFRDSDVLEFDHLPEQFNYRDAQMKDLACCLGPALHGAKPVNTILRGLPGTGKTTSVKRIFAEVEEATKRIIPVYVNCRIDKTLFDILSKIHLQMFGNSPSISEYASQQIHHKIGKAMMERNVVLVVCLEDANYLLPDKVLNSVLSFLLLTQETYPGTKAGVIGTVNNLETDFSRELDPDMISVFRPMEINFPLYTRDEVHGILQDRIRNAFHPGALSDEILNLIVDRTMSCGDLRVGLDLLRTAALYADQEGSMEVSSEHVKSANRDSKDMHLDPLVLSLAAPELGLLTHLVTLITEDPDSPLTSDMLYESALVQMDITPVKFHQWIRKFHEMRLIHVSERTVGHLKKIQEITLLYDPVKVMEACG